MKNYLTWNEIFTNAEGACFGDPELKIKDNARADLESFMSEQGVNPEDWDSVDDAIEDFLEDWDIVFDIYGHLVHYEKKGDDLDE